MKYFLDMEWDGYLGRDISLALVSEEPEEKSLYLSLQDDGPYTAWVMENVIPVLYHGEPTHCEDREEAAARISAFLQRDETYPDQTATIVADWPEDIARFCFLLVIGPGKRVSTPVLTFVIDNALSAEHSLHPHNALFDAIALSTSRDLPW